MERNLLYIIVIALFLWIANDIMTLHGPEDYYG